MSALDFLLPWDSQPQEVAQVAEPVIVAAIPANGVASMVGAGSLYTKPFGLAFGSPGTADGWMLRATPVVSTLDVFTYGCVFSTTVAQRTNGHTIIGERGAAGNELCSIVCGESGGALNSIRAYVRNTAGTLIFITATPAVNDGLLHTAILVKRAANSWELILDGVSVGTNTTNLPGSGWTGNVPSYIAYDPQNTGALFNGVGLAFAIPGVAWSVQQARGFHAAPWATIFAPRSIWVPVSAGGGTATDLTIAEAAHGHTADSPALTLDTTLAIADATHAHTADNITLTTSGTVSLTIADAAHAHVADSPTLTVGYVDLTIADALHGQTADNLTLSISGATNLVIQDATHGHTADAPALSLGYIDLTVADGLHGHSTDNLTLSVVEYTALVIARAMHGHLADNVTLSDSAATVLGSLAGSTRRTGPTRSNRQTATRSNRQTAKR